MQGSRQWNKMLTSVQEACWLQEVLRNPSSRLFALIDKAHSSHTGAIQAVICKMKHPEVWAISRAGSGSFGVRIHQARRVPYCSLPLVR